MNLGVERLADPQADFRAHGAVLVVTDGVSSFVDLDEITPGRAQGALETLLEGRGGSDFADRFHYKFQSIESSEDIQIAIKAQASGPTWGVQGSIDLHTNRQYNRYLISLEQIFYTVTYTPDNDRSKFFADDVVPSDIGPDEMGPGNPPVYIRTVNYGRLVHILIESTSSRTEIETKLKLTYDAAVSSATIDLGLDYVGTLENVNIQAIVYGGHGIGPADLTGDILAAQTALSTPQLITRALPISYAMEDVKDFLPVKVKLATEYDIVDCSPVTAGLENPILIWDAANAVVEAVNSTRTVYFQSDNTHWHDFNRYLHGTGFGARPMKYVDKVPDDSGNGNELQSESNGANRPHIVETPRASIDGQVIEFCNVNYEGIVGGTNFSLRGYQDAHMSFVQDPLENQSYTLFAVVNKPSTLNAYVSFSFEAAGGWYTSESRSVVSTTNGSLFFPENNERGLGLGRHSHSGGGGVDRLWAGHRTGGLPNNELGSYFPEWPTDQFIVIVYRFHKDANSPGYSQRDLFVNGVKTSIQQNDQNYELTSLAALMLMGCRPSGNGTDSIAFQMRLVEIYEGAVLNEKIIERTDQLRDEYHF